MLDAVVVVAAAAAAATMMPSAWQAFMKHTSCWTLINTEYCHRDCVLVIRWRKLPCHWRIHVINYKFWPCNAENIFRGYLQLLFADVWHWLADICKCGWVGYTIVWSGIPRETMDQRLGIRCRLTSAIRRVVTSLSDVHWKHSCSLSTSVSSTLEVFLRRCSI